MPIATEKVAETFLNIESGTPANCIFPLYAEDEIEVIYGYYSLTATLNVDYTVELSAPNYDQFTVTPLDAFITKIENLIAADIADIEINYMTVRRKLDYLTSVQPETVRGTAFLSREIERVSMKLIQLSEIIKRAILFPPKNIGVDETPHFVKDVPIPGALLQWDETGTQVQNFNIVDLEGDVDLSGVLAAIAALTVQVNKALDGIRTDFADSAPYVISPISDVKAEDLSGNLTFVTPPVVARVNGFKATGASISGTMLANHVRQYFLSEAGVWSSEEIETNDYIDITRHPGALKVWELESDGTKIVRISMVMQTYELKIQPTDFYGNIDRLMELYYMRDDGGVDWSAAYTYTTYGQLVTTAAGRVYQVVVPGESGSVAPTLTANPDDPLLPIEDGTAGLFFVGYRDYLGMMRYGVNNGVEGYFSNLALTDMLHRKTLTDSPLTAPKDTLISDLTLKHIKGQFRHLITTRKNSGTYRFGMLMTEAGFIWRQTYVNGGDGGTCAGSTPFSTGYVVGSVVNDGTNIWQAVLPHYNADYFWSRVQKDFLTYFYADAHDSSASTLAGVIEQIGKIRGDDFLIDFLNGDSEVPSGSGTYYTYFELFDGMMFNNLTNQLNNNLTRTFQDDVSPVDGSIYNIQFCEDNCESAVGFRAAAYIYGIMGDTDNATLAQANYVLVDHTGVKGLLNVTVNLYAWYFGVDPTSYPEFPGWYPYCQCQWFAEKCRLDHSTSDIQYAVRAAVFALYPNWMQDKSRNFFPDMFLAVLAAGKWQDSDKARVMVSNFERYYIQQNSATVNEYASYLLAKDILVPPFTLLDVASDGITYKDPAGAILRQLFPT